MRLIRLINSNNHKANFWLFEFIKTFMNKYVLIWQNYILQYNLIISMSTNLWSKESILSSLPQIFIWDFFRLNIRCIHPLIIPWYKRFDFIFYLLLGQRSITKIFQVKIKSWKYTNTFRFRMILYSIFC